MAQRKQRNKLSSVAINKINARYMMKYTQFMSMTAEELQVYSKNKMSFTDKEALVRAYSEKKPITEEVENGASDQEADGN